MLKSKTKYLIKNHPIELEWDFSSVRGVLVYTLNSSLWKFFSTRITKKKQSITIYQNSNKIDFNLYRIYWFRIMKLSSFYIVTKDLELVHSTSNFSKINAPKNEFHFLSKMKNPLLFRYRNSSEKLQLNKISSFKITPNSFTYHE
jgi:hypothetical protein